MSRTNILHDVGGHSSVSPEHTDSLVSAGVNLLPAEAKEPLKVLVDDFLRTLDAARQELEAYSRKMRKGI